MYLLWGRSVDETARANRMSRPSRAGYTATAADGESWGDYMRRSLIARYVDWNWSWNIDSALRYAPVIRFILAAGGADALTCDVGAGTRGGITSYSNLRAVGVDVSYEGEETGRLVRRYPRLWHVCGTARELPFANGTFDFVVCLDTLEHLSEKSRTLVLDELFRIAKDDGTVIVGAPCGVEAHRRDAAMNLLYRKRRGQDHPWLKEHLEHAPLSVAWFEQQVDLTASRRFREYSVIRRGNVSLALSRCLGYLFSTRFPLEQFQRLLLRPVFPILALFNSGACYRRIFVVRGAVGHDQLSVTSEPTDPDSPEKPAQWRKVPCAGSLGRGEGEMPASCQAQVALDYGASEA